MVGWTRHCGVKGGLEATDLNLEDPEDDLYLHCKAHNQQAPTTSLESSTTVPHKTSVSKTIETRCNHLRNKFSHPPSLFLVKRHDLLEKQVPQTRVRIQLASTSTSSESSTKSFSLDQTNVNTSCLQISSGSPPNVCIQQVCDSMKRQIISRQVTNFIFTFTIFSILLH